MSKDYYKVQMLSPLFPNPILPPFNVDFIKFSFQTFRYVIFKFVTRGALASPLKENSN